VFRLRRDETGVGQPLAELGHHLLSAAHLLGEALDPDAESRARAGRSLQNVDQQAEAAAHAVLRNLAASFVTPFDRADAFRLAWDLRRAVARMDAVTQTMEILRVGDLPLQMAELVQVLVRAAEVVEMTVPQLGDPGQQAGHWVELAVLIKQAGYVHRRLLLEVTLAPVDAAAMIRLTELCAALLRVVDALEAVADTIQSVVVTES